jgi:arylformamidase
MSDVMIFSQLGTHFDAPAHFIAGGATSEAVELADCIGPAAVVDVGGRASLDVELFRARERDITATQRVVVNSGWSQRAGSGGYWSGFPELTTEAARLLCSWRVRFLGLDTPTPSLSALHEIHQLLLGHGVVVVECLTGVAALSAVTTVLCLPLPLVGLDGAPVRIVALEPDTRKGATT